jgi:phosphoribosylanthranilate isomerase
MTTARLSPRVKVCGITRLEDARAAVRLGADYLGFVFHPGSPRAVDPETAREIILDLPGAVIPVGVFVDHPPEQVKDIAARSGLKMIQLHGQERVEDYREVGLPIIKAVRVSDRLGETMRLAENGIPSAVFAYLFDTYREGRPGGTGERFDWSRLPKIRERFFLAGGINPENVREALALQPYGIDVSSGLERSPGIKDHDKMERFFDPIHAGRMAPNA